MSDAVPPPRTSKSTLVTRPDPTETPMRPLRSLTCATLCALLAMPAHAVTGARILVDNNPTTGGSTYMASVNDTGQEITVLGTDYVSMHDDPDVAIRSIPPDSGPSRGQETDYTRSHPLYKAAGLGFDQMFPNGVSGGYRYGLECSRVGYSTICHVAPGAKAVTHYRTTCNGKPLQFKVTAWSGRDPGAIGGTMAMLGTTLLSGPALGLLASAYELGGEAYIFTHFSGPMSAARMEEIAAASAWLPNPANSAARAAAVRAGPFVAFLALVAYFELAPSFNPHGALYSDDSYIDFSADGASRVTSTYADSEIEQHLVIDDCLEIKAIAQDVPYLSKSQPRLVPDVNDALVTTVFRRKLPDISANRSCSLRVDDSATRFSGSCTNEQGESVPVFLDASGCTNAADIENRNGVLACVGERIPKPAGNYLRACDSIKWDGSRLAASCGTPENRRRLSLDYAAQCRPNSSVSYESTGMGSFTRSSLRCDFPR